MNIIKGILISAIALSTTICAAQEVHQKSVRREASPTYGKRRKVQRDIPLVNRNFTHLEAGMAVMTIPNLLNDAEFGLHFGLTRACNLTNGNKPFFLQFGIEYNAVSNTANENGAVWTEELSNVALPVTLLYRSELSSDVLMDIFFGPSFRFNCKGERKSGGEYVDYFEDLCAQGFQFGLNVGLSFKFSHVSVNYRFNPDLSDYFDAEQMSREHDNYNSKAQSKTHYHFLSLGYAF